MDNDGSFELAEAAVAVSDRAQARRQTVRSYGQPLQIYATRYDYSLRAIKRWIALGRARAPQDLPPLDDPAEMAAWWERMREAGVFKWKVPEVFGAVRTTAKEGAPTSPVGGVESAAVRRAEESASSQDLGFSAALRRAQEAERLAHARWREELAKEGEEFDPVAERRRAEAWDRTAKLLESLEVKADKVLGRDFVRMEEVEELVVARETALRDGSRSIGTRVATKMNLPREIFDRLVGLFDEELDRVFRHLRGGGEAIFELEA